MVVVVVDGQGEVEQIAMMKPKAASEHEDGMLEFLEDIIGSSRYQQPITVLAARVEELNELRGEKVSLIITCLAFVRLVPWYSWASGRASGL